MASNLYNVLGWAVSTGYSIDNIVSHDGSFWYAKQDHTSQSGANDDVNDPTITHASFWGGMRYISTTQTNKPDFIWLPDYNVAMGNSPKIHTIQFGDGYEQRIVDGINNNLMELSLSFNSRKEAETIAISHFLASRSAKEPFYFRVPEPHNVVKKFVCGDWSTTLVFEDNFNTSASFKEIS